MSYITEIIASSSEEDLLENIILLCESGEHWFISEENKPKIKRIVHSGDKNGFHFTFSCSCNGFFNIDKLIKNCKNKIKCDYFQWVRLDIIPESDFIHTWYDRKF